MSDAARNAELVPRSFGGRVMATGKEGADVATTKELMRHANVSITMDRYVQAVGEQKKQAQHSVVSLLAPNGPTMLKLRTANC
jgi:integrase